jgi:tetratricopeptide (TPR) repeat protein
VADNSKSEALSLIGEASRRFGQGKPEEAQQILDEVERGYIDSDVGTALGHLFLQMQQPGRAISYYSHALQENLDDPGLYVNLATAYAIAGENLRAEVLLRKALELDPDSPKALMNLGAVLINKRNYVEAEELLSRALKLLPANADILANLATISSAKGDFETATALAKKSIKKNPGNAKTYLLLANIDIELGRIDEAIYQFNKAIKTDRYSGQAYTGLAYAKKYTNEDIPAITRYEKLLQDGMPPDCRSHMHFAIGKMRDDLGEYDEAFEHYRQANLLANRRFDKNIELRMVKQFKRIFTKERLSTASELGHQSDVPVFIVGMPRSGTSLTEQIIASHPDASGAGELTDIERIEKRLCESNGLDKFKQSCEASLNPSVLQESGEEYLSSLRNNSLTAKKVVDKTPENFLFLGLIRMLFPNSKIIHVIRNPLDTCLSCYFQDFAQVSWSFDLKDVAQRYSFYREVMHYWKSVLPEGSILDVHYENLIDFPEDESRRIIGFLGLPWDEACLNFHKTERAVRTASMWQVRQPIYKTSKMRARRYAKHLTGLANDLQKYLPDDPEFRKEFGVRKKLLGVL